MMAQGKKGGDLQWGRQDANEKGGILHTGVKGKKIIGVYHLIIGRKCSEESTHQNQDYCWSVLGEKRSRVSTQNSAGRTGRVKKKEGLD